MLEEEVNDTFGLGLDGLVETGLDSFISKICDAKLQTLSLSITSKHPVRKQHSPSAVLLVQ